MGFFQKLKEAFSFGHDMWDPSHRFETSWLFSPWVLFALRLLLCVYVFAVRFVAIAWWCTHPSLGDDISSGCQVAAHEFSYYTVLSYWGLGFYFLVSSLHTFTYARSGRPLLDSFPRPLQALHHLFLTTAVCFPVITTAVWFALLFDGTFDDAFDAWRNISQHALNLLFALFEMVLTRAPPPLWVHLWWVVVLMAMYLGLALVTFETEGFFTYDFLDHREDGGRARVAMWIFIVLAVTIVAYLIAKGLMTLRRWVTEKKLGMDGKFAKQPAWTDDMELNHVGAQSQY